MSTCDYSAGSPGCGVLTTLCDIFLCKFLRLTQDRARRYKTMPQQQMVRAIYHNCTLQLLEPVDLPKGAEVQIALVQIALPIHHNVKATHVSVYPTRAHPPETLCRLRGLLA